MGESGKCEGHEAAIRPMKAVYELQTKDVMNELLELCLSETYQVTLDGLDRNLLL